MANEIYRAIGTPIVFSDSDGTEPITLQNLATGAGRLSDRYDRGAGSQPWLYIWRAVIPFETAPVVGEMVEIRKYESDGTNADAGVGASDAALTENQRSYDNSLLGIVTVNTTSTDTACIASGICLISERYFSVGVWNATADNMQDDANAARVIFTPIPPEIQ